MLSNYGYYQLLIWLLCHSAALFWKIRFPLRARNFTLNKKDKYVHFICVLAGVFLPIVPILIVIADSAANHKSDPTLKSLNISFYQSGLGFGKDITLNECSGSSDASTFVRFGTMSLVTPLVTTFIILTCYYIHKVSAYS